MDPESAAGPQDISEAIKRGENSRQGPDDAAALLYAVADELARVHRLSLDLQALFSRAIAGMDARADVIHEAQGLDRLSQTLENLSRLLHVVSQAHPRQPTERQIDECLTLQDLQSRLCGGLGELPPVALSAVARDASDGRSVAGPAPKAGRCTAESGEISWL